MTFASTLRQLRTARNLTQLELAVKCGLTPTTVSRLESGTSEPFFETVQALAKALDVEIGVFANGSPPSHK